MSLRFSPDIPSIEGAKDLIFLCRNEDLKIDKYFNQGEEGESRMMERVKVHYLASIFSRVATSSAQHVVGKVVVLGQAHAQVELKYIRT